ncbi:DUF2256 and DUF3253 domain-containing protein [Microbacterium sp. ABRD28]|uniref:DUF2256 and DUF3253 domain-containing protein n=1 Tax=Microbacterium sp. ABRD28 TaxID=2268461 RepID=UPI000F5543F4|nr:DUF2256 and DUF3253 domain-containing protein [Microbacterium sp. ABRD28]AZC12714.1 DUF2256 and DUF3253 domain-containing protein [Microbacterium sp. ABRD28]
MGRARRGSDAAEPRHPKICASCGRTMEYRARWAANWDAVKYCSDACRRRGVTPIDRELEASIRQTLASRAASSSMCPSEAAKAVGGEEWRELMEPARRAARRLVAAGEVEITQGGRVVDPSTAKGPIRIRRSPASGATMEA